MTDYIAWEGKPDAGPRVRHRVDLIFRDGQEMRNVIAAIQDWEWLSTDDDILAYRECE